MSWNLLYTIDVISILVFCVSYYLNCYRRGYKIDFWHTQVFLACVFPNMILLPFARNEMNRVILGKDFDAVTSSLPTVFLVTILGYFALLAGGSLWRIRTGLGIRKAAIKVLDFVPDCSMMLMSSRQILVFQAMLCLCMQAAILSIYFLRNGFGFDLRSFTFENPMLRPVAQTASGYSIIIASHCLARYIDRKEKILLCCTLLLTFGLVFFGARSNLVAIYIAILMCYLVKLRRRLNLFWLFGLVALLMSVGFYLGNVRAGIYSLTEFFGSIAFLLFYGNNFSDLRDFAWVYSAWDHVWWGGKTYLAAVTSFVPRAVSSFRDTWGLGVVTAWTAGFDPQVHPGLRPGSFGEGFFNFGLIGVVVVAFLIGVITRRVDIDVKQAMKSEPPSMMRAFASTMLLNVAGCIAISVNVSEFYVLCGIYLFTWICLRVRSLFQPTAPVGAIAV